MKKVLISLCMAAAALLSPSIATAENTMMEELAKELNAAMATDSKIESVAYDGANLVITAAPEDIYMVLDNFEPEQVEAFIKKKINDEVFVADDPNAEMMKQLLKSQNTGFTFIVPAGKRQYSVTFTPEEL